MENFDRMEKRAKTLLIVDDLLQNIELLSDIFKDSFNIITAISAGDALSILESSAEKIDVILLDAVMPKMSGYELLKIISENEKLKHIPVIIITADDDPDSQKKAFDYGAIDFISRPFNIKSVIRRVNSALQTRDLDAVLDKYEQLKIQSDTEKHLAALLDNLPGGVAIIETDGETAQCSYCNSAIPTLFHMSKNQFVCQFSEPDLEPWIKHFMEKAKNNAKLDYIFFVNYDHGGKGEKRRQWIKMSATGIGQNDGKTVMHCVFLDINSEKQQEQRAEEADKRLRQNEIRLESLLNNAPGALIFCQRAEDGNKKVYYLSKGLSDMLGYPNDEQCIDAIGENPSAGISPEDLSNVRKMIDEAAKKDGTIDYAFRCKNYHGGMIWLSFKGQLTYTESGKLRLYGFVADITKEKSYEHELQVNAFYDILTGLYNRKAFYLNAKRLIEANPDKEYWLVRLNIGSFKLINDLMGRDIGDRVLIEVADIIRREMSNNGIYARFSSDHFVLMSCNYSHEDWKRLLAIIKEGVAKTNVISHEVQYYMGVYKVADRSITVESMCDRAMLACQSIKGSFTTHIAYYDEKMRSSMLEEQEICDQAHKAMANGEFKIYYQSVYGIKAQRFVSAEALVRWVHPTKGVISPGKFIPVFEKNGLIAELDMYVLEHVCMYHKKRKDQGLPPFPISVNISRMSLYNPRLYDRIREMTEKYKVEPKYFRIEITESAYNDNPTQLLETVGKLRHQSYPILMDDFGSGYSSLNTLKDIPIDLLKLDMKFMEGFEKSGKVGTIVTAVARMSKWLNVPMLAEGVETKEQYEFLKSVGCAYIQGYYFAKPVCEEEFTELIAQEYVTGGNNTTLESYGMSDDINEILGHNAVVSKLINGVFGGLGIYEYSEGRFEVIRVNEGYMQIMGFSPEDQTCEYDNALDNIHPDDLETCREAIKQAVQTDEAVRLFVRRYDRNNNLIYLDGVFRRLGGSDASPIFCYAFNDISEQLKNDELIRRTRHQIHTVLDATGAVVMDLDLDTDSVFCSGELDTYGLTPSQLAEMVNSPTGLCAVAHPDDQKRMALFHKLSGQGRFSDDFRVKMKSGEYRWVRITKTFIYDESGKPVRLMGIATDIDAEKKASIALENAQKQMNVALSNINAGLLVVEEQESDSFHIVYSNDGFWKLIDKEPDENFDFFGGLAKYVGEDEVERLKKSAVNGESTHCNLHLLHSDGTEVRIDLAIVAVDSHKENNRQYIAMFTDITQQYMTAYKLDAIVRNFNGGLALVTSDGKGGCILDYANEKFYSYMCIDKTRSDKLADLLSQAIARRRSSIDMPVPHTDGTEHIINISINEAGVQTDSKSYIIKAEDVTIRRAEAKNRIAERKDNAAAGLYDEVFEINYKSRTTKMVASRRTPQRVRNAKILPLEFVLSEWVDKYIHPDDVAKARELYNMPDVNPDFTDYYAELRIMDYIDGNYKTFGTVLVRAGGDIAMLYSKDLSRIDNAMTSAEVEETNRLYRLVAEQTNTTVIEYNHLNDTVSTSPTITDYAFDEADSDRFKIDYREGFCVFSDDKKLFLDYLKKLKPDSKPENVVIRLKTADGSYKWCRLCVTLKSDKAGNIVKSLTTINQVNDEVEARIKAEKVDALLRRTVRHIPVGVGIYQLEGEEAVPIYLSDNTFKLFGANGIYRKLITFDYDEFAKNNSLETGAEGEYTMRCAKVDGTGFWLTTKYRVMEENGNKFIYAAMEDDSDRIEAQRKQAAQEQLHELLLEETRTIIFDFNNLDDKFSYYEPSDWDSDDEDSTNSLTVIEGVLSGNGLDFIEEEDRIKFVEALKRLSENEGAQEVMVRINADGYPRRYRAFIKSTTGEDGKVFRVVGKIEDVDDEMTRLDRIKAQAMYDALCVDVYNKATTQQLIKSELENCTSGALMMIDVDNFKLVNDLLGHMFGDEFLKQFATIIKSSFRDSDIVGRYGGDEFFVFIKHGTAVLAEKKGQQILEKVAALEIPQIGSVKTSVGIAVVNPENRRYNSLIKQADSALYAAKNRGKNCVAIFDPVEMTEDRYRTSGEQEADKSNPVLSSNPEKSASLIMRIFSALYSSSELSVGISQMLGMAGKAFDVSRAYIFEDIHDGEYCCNTFEWCSDDVNPFMDMFQCVSYEADLGGGYRDNFNDDGIFYCHDVNELKTAQRSIFEKQGIKSLLQCSIVDNGEFKGFVGFDECRSNRFWTQEQIDALVFISKVISIFLLKERGRTLTENYARSIKSILDDYPHYIYIVDVETRSILYMNHLTESAVGKGKLGLVCEKAICNRSGGGCPVEQLEKTGKGTTMEMFSPNLNKKLRTHAVEVQWEGKRAYLVTSEVVE